VSPQFSAFNPGVWLCFTAFVVATWAIVTLFRRNYPDYGRFGDATGRGEAGPADAGKEGKS
jgi:hypothetical protein